MAYNHAKEQKKWKAWKEKEEKMLRDLNVSESKIAALREYDHQAFKSDRNYREKESTADIVFFTIQPHPEKNEVMTITDLLDSIENEALYELLKEQDEMTLQILLLRVHGYSVKEIAAIMGITVRTVFRKIKKMKNNL